MKNLLFICLVATASMILHSATAASNENEDLNLMAGKFSVEYLPRGQMAVREHLLSEMTRATAPRMIVRFLPATGTTRSGKALGTFKQSISSIFPRACHSSPDPLFWETYGEMLLPASNVQVSGGGGGAQMTVSLSRVPAAKANMFLPGGRAQDITCGPIALLEGAESPTTTGVFFQPDSFTFRIEPVRQPILSVLNFPDMEPMTSNPPGRSTVPHATRTDSNLFEIFASQKDDRGGGISFYVGALGNRFRTQTEDDREALRRYFAYDALRCWPAPCHLAMRNRTFDFPSLHVARRRAVGALGLAPSMGHLRDELEDRKISFGESEEDRRYMERSWLDGSGAEARERNSIFQPTNVKIQHSGLVLIIVTADELAQRGFDLVPHLDDVMKNKKMPAEPDVYKIFIRPPPPELTELPFERDSPLTHYPYLRLEAPYHPQQVLRLTRLEQDRDEYNPTLTPLVLTDRCLASGMHFDVDRPLQAVLPTYVHRCMGDQFLIHATLAPSTHPLGQPLHLTYTLARCWHREDQIGCKQHLFQELPPEGNEWAKRRLQDIPGFNVEDCSRDGKKQDGDDAESEQQQYQQKQKSGSAPNEYMAKMMADLEAEHAEQSCNPRNDRRSSYTLASERILPDEVHSGRWIQSFDDQTEGALKVRVVKSALRGFRSNGQVTVLSTEVHPMMMRNPRHSVAAPFGGPMTVVVVPSPGVLRLEPRAGSTRYGRSAGDDTDRDDGVVLPPAVSVVRGEDAFDRIPTGGETLSLDLSWAMDSFDSFSQSFIDAVQQQQQQQQEQHKSGDAAVLHNEWMIVTYENTGDGRVRGSSPRCDGWLIGTHRGSAGLKARTVQFSRAGTLGVQVHLEFEAPQEAAAVISAATFMSNADEALGRAEKRYKSAVDMWNEAANCMLEVRPPPMVSAEWTKSKQRPLVQPLKLLYMTRDKMQHVDVSGFSASSGGASIGPLRYTLVYRPPVNGGQLVHEMFDATRCQLTFVEAVKDAKQNWKGLSSDARLDVVWDAGSNEVTADFESKELAFGPENKRRGAAGSGWAAMIVIDNVQLELVEGKLLIGEAEAATFTVPLSVATACGAPLEGDDKDAITVSIPFPAASKSTTAAADHGSEKVEIDNTPTADL